MPHHTWTEPRDQEPDDFELRLAATRAAIARDREVNEAQARIRQQANADLMDGLKTIFDGWK